MFSTMATFLFTCPRIGIPVQGWFVDDGAENGGDTYEPVTCLACRQVHMVNPRTGRILGADEE
jgi:hypothetical protein